MTVSRRTPDEPPIADAIRRISDAFTEPGTARLAPSADILRAAEALLFAAGEAMPAAMLAERLGESVDIAAVLMRLKKDYEGRGVELKEVAGGWRFQTAEDLAPLFEKTRQAAKKLPRTAMETLAVIAYHQPVTRAEIEDIRGVSLSRGALDLLLEIGWVRPLGRRRTPGRPLTFGTTTGFLEHFGLASLDALPGKDDLKGLGLLDGRALAEIEVPRPADELAAAELDEEEATFVVDHMGDDE